MGVKIMFSVLPMVLYVLLITGHEQCLCDATAIILPDYGELYPEQWSHGFCYRDCMRNMFTFCSKADHFCQSCAIYCKDGEPRANEEDCKSFCPAYYAYKHPSSTKLEPPSTVPTIEQPSPWMMSSKISSQTVVENHKEEHIAHKPSSFPPSNEKASSRSFSDIVASKPKEKKNGPHLLWLLLPPFTIIITLVLIVSLIFCYQESLRKTLTRWANKLRDITCSFEPSTGNRWNTEYFVLPSTPPESALSDEAPFLDEEKMHLEVTKATTEEGLMDNTLLFDKSWPHPYSGTTV